MYSQAGGAAEHGLHGPDLPAGTAGEERHRVETCRVLQGKELSDTISKSPVQCTGRQ
jgi:hypothetical protein